MMERTLVLLKPDAVQRGFMGKIITRFENAGFKAVQWQGRNDFGQPVGAGVYICQIRAGDFVQTSKMILLK